MADPADVAAGVPDATTEPPGGLDAALGLVGLKLDELEGNSVGRIEGVLKDAGDDSPTWLVVKVGHFGKRAAVPFEYTAAGVGHVWTPFGKGTIRAACELDPVLGLSAADERALAMHYGVPEGSGRLDAVSGLGDEEPGSVPA
ncbi:MAG: hypothetical protein KDB58_13710 [Solirubrobacterales bacterium]|nr:hypothetical protein [Solirubrobacterales bacterium]MCO5327314.1 hypothetical protein [Solirubrobacterales bacterium]